MMNDVNVLWSSAWLTLQKNLANSLAAAGTLASTGNAPVQAGALSTSSWLARAHSRMAPMSEII
jgi:hypothetical protein